MLTSDTFTQEAKDRMQREAFCPACCCGVRGTWRTPVSTLKKSVQEMASSAWRGQEIPSVMTRRAIIWRRSTLEEGSITSTANPRAAFCRDLLLVTMR